MLAPRNQPLGGKYVGAGGALMTPEQAAQQKQIAAALLEQAGDTSPVGHWTAALNRGLQGYLGGRDMYKARQAESEGRAGALERFNQRLSGNGAVDAVASAMSMGAPYTPPAEAAAIREGLIARGLPEHIADGFIMNFQDESGLNPGINERNPVVPGSRGGFGLYQLTGPRRTAYESFASERGVDPDDVDAQLDWLMYELQGPEAKAAQSIFASQNAGEAGAAIVNQFLRPAAEHRQSRASRYLGGAGAGTSQAPRAGNVSQIAALLADPWLPQDAKAVLQAEMNQQMQMQNAAYEMQLQQQDPMRQLQMQQAQLGNQRAQLELEQMRNPAPVLPEAPETQVFYDEATGQEYRAQWNPASMSWDRIGGVKAPSAPLVQNTIGGGESEFNKEVGKNQASTFNEMSASGFTAAQNLGNLDRLESLLAQGPSGASAALQNLAANYGIDVGSAGTLQAANALINAMVPGQRPAGSGPMSDRDVQMFKDSLPRLINSAEGNALVIQTLRGIAQYDLQRAEIADRAMLPESDPMHLPRNEAAKALRQLRSPLSDFGKAASQFEAPKADAAAVPQGVDPADWEFMTDEEKALFQ